MGIHICLYRANASGRIEEHATWDWTRHWGDRDLPGVLRQVGEVRLQDRPVDVPHVRPVDVEAFRLALHSAIEDNRDRWNELAKILEDPQWWMYFSY